MIVLLVPLMVIGFLTATDLISLRELTEYSFVGGAVTDVRQAVGTEVSHTAEFALALLGGLVIVFGLAGASAQSRRS